MPRFSDLPDAAGELTAGDLSRLLGVDLKSVHNWERRELLKGRRTPGGHLRFRRLEVIRFLRACGLEAPVELRKLPLRIGWLGVAEPPKVLEGRPKGPKTEVHALRCPFSAAICAAAEQLELLALSSLGSQTNRVSALVRALEASPKTQGIVILTLRGLEPAELDQARQLRASLAAARPELAYDAVQYLTGWTDLLVPGLVDLTDASEERRPRAFR